jgi:hypothetical protein
LDEFIGSHGFQDKESLELVEFVLPRTWEITVLGFSCIVHDFEIFMVFDEIVVNSLERTTKLLDTVKLSEHDWPLILIKVRSRIIWDLELTTKS